jgi:hypothetical protein
MSTTAVEDASDVSELTSRFDGGVDVSLLWRRSENTAIVAVADHRTGEAFVLDVHGDDDALDMFHHPYAYAALRIAA